MIRILLISVTLLLFAACQSNNTQAKAEAEVPATPEIPAGEVKYPPIVAAEMQELVQKTTLVDFIFYNKNFSMNLDNKQGIMNALRQIGEQPAPIREGCKATGRVIYQGDGEIIKEADFYFEHPCFYFIFIEDDKPVKANLMTAEGVEFFNKLMRGVSAQ